MNGRILNVPYKSQNDADATLKRSDCGPACIAMLLGALGKAVTTNAVTLASGMTGDNGLRLEQMIAAAKAFGLDMISKVGFTLDDLKKSIDRGCPLIALIKYGKLLDRRDQAYVGGHFVVVVGYDDVTGRVFINDPDYPPGALGYQRPYPYRNFLGAWSGFDPQDRNPNYCVIIPQISLSVPGTDATNDLTPLPSVGEAWVSMPLGLTLWSKPDMSALVISELTFGQHLAVLSASQSWRQVRTDSGLAGWTTDSVGEHRALSSIQPPVPFTFEVIDAPPTVEAGGVSVRQQCDLDTLPFDRVQVGERLTIYDARVAEDGTTWWWALSPRLQIGWIRDRAGDVALVRRSSLDTGTLVDTSTPTPGVPPTAPSGINPNATSVVWVTAPKGLVFRTEASSSAQRLGSFRFGQRLTAVGTDLPPDEAGKTWQEIRTEEGVTGYVLSGQGLERYLAYRQPLAPYAIQVLDTSPAREAGGLRVYDDRRSASSQIDGVKPGERLAVYGTVNESAEVAWLWVRSPRGQYGWLRENEGTVTLVSRVDIDVLALATTEADVRPFGQCLSGLGLANPQPLTALELAVISKSHVEAVKLLTLPNPEQMKRLIETVKQIPTIKLLVARLFFPVDANSKTRFSPQVFVNTILAGTTAAYQAGVRYFEIHNEPNLENEGLGWNWANGAEFGSWLMQVTAILRQRFPGSQLGFPGLSPQPNVSDFLDGASIAIDQCDWIGVHAYWQTADNSPGSMTGPEGGMYWRKFRDRYAGKLLMITEFSNNQRAVDLTEKGRQYASYFQLMRQELNVGAAFAFALSWPGQDANREGWVVNGRETEIATTVGALIG